MTHKSTAQALHATARERPVDAEEQRLQAPLGRPMRKASTLPKETVGISQFGTGSLRRLTLGRDKKTRPALGWTRKDVRYKASLHASLESRHVIIR